MSDETTTPNDPGAPLPGCGQQTGWICPLCGKANAPWVPQCHCNSPSCPAPQYPYGPWQVPPDHPVPQPYWPSQPLQYPERPIITCCAGGPR